MTQSRAIIRLAVVAALFLAAPGAPSRAQSADPTPDPELDPLFPDEEELRELGDLAGRMLRRFADQMEPMAERLRALVDDLDAYQAPERLPNGDIIIRRKPDAPAPAEEDGIDL